MLTFGVRLRQNQIFFYQKYWNLKKTPLYTCVGSPSSPVPLCPHNPSVTRLSQSGQSVTITHALSLSLILSLTLTHTHCSVNWQHDCLKGNRTYLHLSSLCVGQQLHKRLHFVIIFRADKSHCGRPSSVLLPVLSAFVFTSRKTSFTPNRFVIPSA